MAPYLPLAAPPFLSASPSLLMINQTHRPLWSAVSCYLVTSCRDLPGPLVFPWRLCLLAALSRWPVATPGPDPQLPASTASWSHTAVSVCSRRTAAPHHARLVKFNFWTVCIVADWSRQRDRDRERGRDDIVDSNYAVSMLRVAFTQLHLITHQHDEENTVGVSMKGKVHPNRTQKNTKKYT